MAYASTRLSPEEQVGVPMLTNIPETAETAAGRGQDVYFLSDRPETEQFLAERTPERPYKRVLRDVRASRPFVDEDQLMDAVEKGKKFLGFNPMEPPNPGQVAQEAYQKYFDRVPKEQYENWPDNIKQMHVKAAQAEEKKAYDRAVKDIANAHQYLTSHASEWDKQKMHRTEQQRQLEETQKPGQAIPAINPDTNKKQWYFIKTKTWGPEIAEGMIITQDAEGNPIYTPTTQARGQAPAPRPGVEKPGKKISYVGWNWDKSGEEVVEEISESDTDAIADLVNKGYIPKKKYDSLISGDLMKKEELGELKRQSRLKVTGKRSEYKTPEEVRRALNSGKIKREQARRILLQDFGMTTK